jgi:hypothetical protein
MWAVADYTRAGAATPIDAADLERVVADVVDTTEIVDIHTHLFPPGFGSLSRSGIDDLLTYHYLEAEFFRHSPVTPGHYWSLPRERRAELVWQTLFVENTPLSEAARGVVTILHALGLDPGAPTLAPLREYFRGQDLAGHVQRILSLARVTRVVMTNDPLDPEEAPVWTRGVTFDDRFQAALRLDAILNGWESHVDGFAAAGHAVDTDAGGRTILEIRRFLDTWIGRMRPRYMAVSLPDTFVFPQDDLRTRLLTGAVLPACREHRLPLSLMIGVRRQVNPALRLAGDALGRADIHSIGVLCRDFPDNRFMVSALSRENQHELCVYARKFANLMPFGCWWFVSVPSTVDEITQERLELLGTSFIPQHSDARVLEQLLYKWRDTRRALAPILARTYERIARDGRHVTEADIRHDVGRLFRKNFEDWAGG